MLPKSDWKHLIPHAGSMCLLDAVADWDHTQIHATSSGHRDPSHPLRRDGHLHAIHLAEYGAQATAVHGALRARAGGFDTPKPGLLVTLRDLRLAREYVEDLTGDLHIHAQCLFADDRGAQYSFRVLHGDDLLVHGRCAVIHPG